ncbi:hypothetical protein [Ruminococcus sp. FC2018]|uniref:hypothetical protein n=1 Tax=Ruminococcus sp. FC2018 TaxID=1410617 RepID=UPI00048F8E2A|nr:hypothetical protein [Ruminococcus sp. FC2018]
MKNRLISIGLFVLTFVIFWNLFDFGYCKIITRSSWSFTVGKNIMYPAVMGATISLVLPIFNRIGKKK